MIRVHRSFYILLLFFCACSFSKHSRIPVMTYQQCMASEVCSLTGTVKIEEVNHAFMGRLVLHSGECVHLSLSDKLVKDIRQAGQAYLNVYGDRLPKPIGMEEIDFLEVNGRRVGWDICSDYYIFVSQAKVITKPN